MTNLKLYQRGRLDVSLVDTPTVSTEAPLYRVNSNRPLPSDVDIHSMKVGEVKTLKTNLSTSNDSSVTESIKASKQKSGNMYKSRAVFEGPKKAIDVNSLLPSSNYLHQKEFILKAGTRIKLKEINDDIYVYEVVK